MIPEYYQDFPDPRTTPTAGFLIRLGAAFIDLIVLAPLTFATYYFMSQRPALEIVVALAVLTALYKPVLESFWGRTVGKMLLKLRVIDRRTGKRITLGQSFTRYLPWALSAFATLFVLIRIYEAPDFSEVESIQGYIDYVAKFPLSNNLLVSMLNNAPIFSAVWIIMDPWNRALHDRWAETFVLRDRPLTVSA